MGPIWTPLSSIVYDNSLGLRLAITPKKTPTITTMPVEISSFLLIKYVMAAVMIVAIARAIYQPGDLSCAINSEAVQLTGATPDDFGLVSVSAVGSVTDWSPDLNFHPASGSALSGCISVPGLWAFVLAISIIVSPCTV